MIAKNKMIGLKIIETAIKMDGTLIEFLKLEIKRLKKQIKNDNNFDDYQKTDKLIRNIIIALTVSEERIRLGLELMKDDREF